MKSRGPLSRHETAEGGRGPARPARRMPGLSSHRAPGHTSKSSIEIPPQGRARRTAKASVMDRDVQYLIMTTPATHKEWFR